MEKKYNKGLITKASKLDFITNSEGRIIQCVLSIINKEEKAATPELLKIIQKIIDSGERESVQLSLALKDILVQYHGYERIQELCIPSIDDDSGEENELSLDELLMELNQLVGLNNVKMKVNDLIAYQKVQALRRDNGLSTTKNTLHLAFTGNPGTGKTTVARIVGRIYKQIGLLSKGHFTEVSRTDLIAGYQGQTALKVKKVIEKAKGGVLFIDEAYSITENDRSDSYGRECLTELTKALEDFREDLVVIVAGYTEPMNKFFNSNPGLKSRFNTFINFEDYDSKELNEIFLNLCQMNEYYMSSEGESTIHALFSDFVLQEQSQSGNGRLVRNLYEAIIMNHSRRVSKIENPTVQDLSEIKENDILQAKNEFIDD